MATNQINITTNSLIPEDWNGGYKVEVDLTAQSQAKNWTIDFKLPYQISESYGVDLVNNGDGSYTINGQNDQVDLKKGQTIKPIFIVQDGGKQALAPEFISMGSQTISEPQSKWSASPSITEDWNGGYKVELD